MEHKRSGEEYEGFLCKSLGVFENGGIFDEGTHLGSKNSPEGVKFDSPERDKSDFWGFPRENGRELCDNRVKIKDWMDSLNVCDHKMEFFDFESRENEQKRNILIRHDFNKETLQGNCIREYSPQREILTDIPLSPETQKKNELCSYLQLMNMNNADKKTVSAIQNRRSNRVKNLKIMSEKRILEQKLLREFKDGLEKKSLDELGVVITENYHITNTIEKINFNTGNLPDNLLKEVKYFDDAIMEVIGVDIKKKIQSDHKNNNHTYKKKKNTQVKDNKKQTKDLKTMSVNKNRILNLRSNVGIRKSLRSSMNLNDGRIKALILNETKIKCLRSSVNLNNVGIKSLTLNEKKMKQDVKVRLQKLRQKENKRRIDVKIKLNNERINNRKSKRLYRNDVVRKKLEVSRINTRKRKIEVNIENVRRTRSNSKGAKTIKNVKLINVKINKNDKNSCYNGKSKNVIETKVVKKKTKDNKEKTENKIEIVTIEDCSLQETNEDRESGLHSEIENYNNIIEVIGCQGNKTHELEDHQTESKISDLEKLTNLEKLFDMQPESPCSYEDIFEIRRKHSETTNSSLKTYSKLTPKLCQKHNGKDETNNKLGSVKNDEPKSISSIEKVCGSDEETLCQLNFIDAQNETSTNLEDISETTENGNVESPKSERYENVKTYEISSINTNIDNDKNVELNGEKTKSPIVNNTEIFDCDKSSDKTNSIEMVNLNDEIITIQNNKNKNNSDTTEKNSEEFEDDLDIIPLKRRLLLKSYTQKKSKIENDSNMDNVKDLTLNSNLNPHKEKVVKKSSKPDDSYFTKNISPQTISPLNTVHLSSPSTDCIYHDSLSPASKSTSEISKCVFREDKIERSNKVQTSFNVIDLSQNSFDSNSPYTNYTCWQEHNYTKNPDLDMEMFNKDLFLNETSNSELSNDDREFLKESYKEIPRINSVPPTDIFEPKVDVVPVEKPPKTPVRPKKALHKLLMEKNRNSSDTLETVSNEHCFDDRISANSIKIDFTKGKVLNAHYLGFNLVIIQEQLISFWTQSPLGNMLGVHNLWLSKGQVQRLPLDSNYICKESQQVVVNLENKSCAYIELWMKEHKSEKRELPLADVFATVYFWTSKNSMELNKKLLQLANIKGNIKDVQYVVLRTARKIVVSWVETQNSLTTTLISCYTLSPDYQTVVSVLEMTSINHYVESLHTIGDCSDAVVGFGENHITIWELEYGEIFETIEINQRYNEPRMLWLERDRGLLFFIQYHMLERLLMLVAVNGYSKESKKMQVFRVPAGYDTLKGVCVDNNMMGAVFSNGIICWNIKTGDEIMAELSSHPYLIPSNKHLIELKANTAEVTHFQSYFLTNFDLQS